MFTALMILVAVVLVAVLAGGVYGLARGDLCICLWWACGGFGRVCSLLGEVLGAIASGLAGD